MIKRTEIIDLDKKQDIIDHINQDHTEELLIIAQDYEMKLIIKNALIEDIFQEGVLLALFDKENKKLKNLFVEFQLRGDLEEQILYLAYQAFIKNNRDLSGNKTVYFDVVNVQKITQNFIRIKLKILNQAPNYYAAYAYGFQLKILNKKPKNIKVLNKKSKIKNLMDRMLLWLIKILSSKSRQRLIENINKGIRIYTLRKLFEGNYAYIDIYTHDNSAGSQWVKLLKQGDVILSKTEVADKHTHLNKGQVVFIADETAYPAVAGILDFWKNPIPPLIILLASDVRDYTYFDDFNFPLQSEVHRVNCQPGQQAEKVINILEQKILIENVWGALENDAAKKIRHYLRNQRDLNGKNNHMKGYWRLNKL